MLYRGYSENHFANPKPSRYKISGTAKSAKREIFRMEAPVPPITAAPAKNGRAAISDTMQNAVSTAPRQNNKNAFVNTESNIFHSARIRFPMVKQ